MQRYLSDPQTGPELSTWGALGPYPILPRGPETNQSRYSVKKVNKNISQNFSFIIGMNCSSLKSLTIDFEWVDIYK